MVNTLLGIKQNMISTYDARGRRVGATVISVGSNFVTQIKNKEKDGYEATQLGFGTKKSVKKPQLGQGKKAGVNQPLRYFREVTGKVEDLGKEIHVGDVFVKGDAVKVTGVSKGRGFAGGVKRYGFAGGPKTHGQSDRHRAPGSVGSGTTPGRVFKGKRMAGHFGSTQFSVKGLEVIAVDRKSGFLTVKGGIPGHTGALVEITKLGKIRGHTPPPEEKEDEEEEAVRSENQNVNQPEQAEAGQATEGQENA